MDVKDLIENEIRPQIKQPLWESWYIKEKIGSGAFSVVYRMEANRADGIDEAALKIEAITAGDMLITDVSRRTAALGQKMQMAVNETRIMKQLRDCSNIVRYEEEYTQELYLNGQFEGYYHLIRMEYLDNVSSLMKSHRFEYSEENVRRLAIEIGTGLKAAHDMGIIHRDLKPDNMFVSSSGVYKLGDFNISKKAISTRSFAGSNYYIAPEVFRAKSSVDDSYSSQADIYSLGICLYQMMNDGLLPFEETLPTEDAIDRRMQGESFLPPKNASKIFGKIILKMCAFDTRDRYQSIEDTIRDLRDNVFQHHVHEQKSMETVYIPPAKRSNALIIASVCMAAVIATIVGVLLAKTPPEPPSPELSSIVETVSSIESNSQTIQTNKSESEIYNGDESSKLQDSESVTEPSIQAIPIKESDLSYTLEDDTLTILGTGAMPNFESSSRVPWFSQRNTIKNVIIADGITTIGDFAFYYCSSLKDIEIPNSITYIGNYSFSGCFSITIPDHIISIIPKNQPVNIDSSIYIQVFDNDGSYERRVVYGGLENTAVDADRDGIITINDVLMNEFEQEYQTKITTSGLKISKICGDETDLDYAFVINRMLYEDVLTPIPQLENDGNIYQITVFPYQDQIHHSDRFVYMLEKEDNGFSSWSENNWELAEIYDDYTIQIRNIYYGEDGQMIDEPLAGAYITIILWDSQTDEWNNSFRTPFKTDDNGIVTLKQMAVWECMPYPPDSDCVKIGCAYDDACIVPTVIEACFWEW